MASKYKSNVYLEEKQHVYINKITGKRYNSVTRAIAAIEPEFKADDIALAISHQPESKRKPEYSGMSQSEILSTWDVTNRIATDYGSMVHKILEDYLLCNKWYTPKNDFEEAVIKAYDALNIDEGCDLYAERILFSEEYELAGMTDLLIDIDEIFYDILDYKTNKAFNYFSPYKTYLNEPLSHLPDCQYSTYSLQLSIYALMYEMEYPHRKCRQLSALWFNKETLTFSRIPVIYLKSEALKLMQMHKYNAKLQEYSSTEKFDL